MTNFPQMYPQCLNVSGDLYYYTKIAVIYQMLVYPNIYEGDGIEQGIGLIVRCMKMINFYQIGIYYRSEKALTNQLTNKTEKNTE